MVDVTPNFVHCPITLDGGHQQQARYVRVDMGTDPHVIGRVWGSSEDYAAPLYAQPDHTVLECPRYGMDDVWRLRWGADDAAIFNASLDFLGDRTLTAEIHRFQESGRIIAELDADIRRLENRKWEAGCIQEASICCLESANALERLDWAQAVHHMHAIECSDAAVCHGRRS